MIYLSMFISALISATIFPLGSEGLLLFYLNEKHNIILLLLFATIGNTIGSIINYFIGYKGEVYLEKKSILKKERVEHYGKYFNKFGGYSLLLSWVPIIGDPITLVSGLFKYDFIKFVLIVLFAKFSRYFVIALAFL